MTLMTKEDIIKLINETVGVDYSGNFYNVDVVAEILVKQIEKARVKGYFEAKNDVEEVAALNNM